MVGFISNVVLRILIVVLRVNTVKWEQKTESPQTNCSAASCQQLDGFFTKRKKSQESTVDARTAVDGDKDRGVEEPGSSHNNPVSPVDAIAPSLNQANETSGSYIIHKRL